MNLFNLEDQVAVVTGASSGLGADAARAYAKAGAKVALLARRQEKLEQLAAEITADGGQALTIPTDVSSEQSVKQAVEQIIDKFGKIDILLNNAGTAKLGSVEDIEEEHWDKVLNVNVKGPYLMSKYIVPHMKKRNYGRIVNIASVNAFLGDKHPSLVRHSYNASKAAVVGLTKGMATSLGMYGITVNALGPGLFETEMTVDSLFKAEKFMQMYNTLCPAGRPGKKGEMNGPILFLSSKESSYINGQIIYVDGGFGSV